ncbi:DUF1554 domain-containing protein [Leptospira sp. 96542]|nr:DUF1554 domain-containing protein [Leptospira sp. 96542]
MVKYFYFLLLVISLSFCSENRLDNVCDINSDSFYANIFILQVFGDANIACPPGKLNFENTDIKTNLNFAKLSESGMSLSDGSSVDFDVSFKKPPKSDVFIEITISNNTSVIANTTKIVLSPSNWYLPQVLTLTAVNDSLLNGKRQIQVSLIPSSEDTSLNLTPKVLTIEIEDNDKRIFASNNTYTGGIFGGVQGADSICQAECPAGLICKAMIVDGINRIASVNANIGDGQVDWVLLPFAHYYRKDGTTLVSNTNQTKLLQFNFTNLIDPVLASAWMGSSASWVHGPNDCDLWRNNTNTITGNIVRLAYGDNLFFGGNFNCNNSVNLVCVEQ